MDDKALNVELPEEEVPKFLECLKANKEYWAPNAETAFATSFAQVRYTSITKTPDAPPVESAAVSDAITEPVEVKNEV